MSLLSESDAIWAADQFIDYYSNFNRIDDYMRFVKQSRMSNSLGRLFGPEDEIFSDFSIHPSEMSFTIHEVDTSLKPKTKYNQDLYSEVLNITASNAIEEAIPGRTIKWMVTEDTTKKVIGVVRFGSPTINSKPRNDYFGEVLPLSKINHGRVIQRAVKCIRSIRQIGYNKCICSRSDGRLQIQIIVLSNCLRICGCDQPVSMIIPLTGFRRIIPNQIKP